MDRSATPLPFSSPRWMTTNRVALAAVSAFASIATAPAIWWIDDVRREIGPSKGAMTAVIFITIGLSVLLMNRALKAASAANAVMWCVFGAIPLGVLNSGLSLCVVQLVRHGDPGQAVGGLILGVLIGGFYGAPIGLVFGSAYAFVAVAGLRASQNPSHDGADRMLLTSGIWLAFSAAAILAWAPSAPSSVADSAFNPHSIMGVMLESPSDAPLFLAMIGGVVCTTVAGLRLLARLHWLRRVRQGHEQDFRIEPRSGAETEGALLPVVRPGLGELGAVVTHRPSLPGGPYRELPHGTPVALDELPAGNA